MMVLYGFKCPNCLKFEPLKEVTLADGECEGCGKPKGEYVTVTDAYHAVDGEPKNRLLFPRWIS